MKTAIIVYSSKGGTTKYFAHYIAEYISKKDIKATTKSIYDIKPEEIANYDYVLLGCWTHGLFIAFQHPNRDWVNWAKKLPDLSTKKVALFTTYKLATGSMFHAMRKRLTLSKEPVLIQAKGEELNTEHEELLNKLFLD